MIRQSLDADSAYVDVALHGDGLTSLQFREAKGAATHEVQANVVGPARLRLEKRGKYVADVPGGRGRGAEVLRRGRADRVRGAVLRRHRRLRAQQGRDREGRLLQRGADRAAPAATGRPVLYSTLETQAIASTDRRVVHVTPSRIEAPNWLRDGQTLIYNSGGRIYRIPAAGGKPEAIDTGFATRCNNDHGVSPDGTMLAISDQSQGRRQSLIYTLPVAGGTPKLVTPTGPSYWHGWSPDGKTLAYLRRAQRRVRHLHHPRRRRRRDAADDGQGAGRRPRVLARRQVHLLQLRPHRHDADLADEARRQRAGAGHRRRVQQLVPAPLARRPVDGVPLLREGRRPATRRTRT